MVNERKFLTIVLIIIALLLVPLYYYSSNSVSSITGHATATPTVSSPQKVGEYSIKGDFTVDLKQDFNDYKTMRSNARLMLEDVLKCELDKQISLEECIKEVNTSLKLEWLTSCEDEQTAYFYEFIESYIQCAESNDNYCFCDLPINYNVDIEDFKLTFQERKTSSKNDGTIFKINDLEYFYPGYVPYEKKSESLMTRFIANVKNFFFSSTDTNINTEPIISLSDKIVDAEEFDNDEGFSIFKIDKSMAIMTKDEKDDVMDENKDHDYLDVHTCKIPNRRKYKFCVKSDMKTFSYDKINKKGQLNDVMYKFALDFSDDISPTQSQTIELNNIKNKKESLMLEWTASADLDVNHYNIYFSTTPINIIDTLNPIAYATKSDTSFEIIYYLKQGLKQKIEDGVTYYATVIPVDNSNNYIRSGINYVSGISSDDSSFFIN